MSKKKALAAKLLSNQRVRRGAVRLLMSQRVLTRLWGFPWCVRSILGVEASKASTRRRKNKSFWASVFCVLISVRAKSYHPLKEG